MSEGMAQAQAVAAEMCKLVLDNLRKRVSSRIEEDWSVVTREIEDRSRSLENSDGWRVVDPQGLLYFKLGCTSLAIYRALAPRFQDKNELLDILRRVLIDLVYQEGMIVFLLQDFGISPDKPGREWEGVCGYIPRAQAQFGQGWEFEQGMRDEHRYFVNVRKCLFAEFFLAHDAREVLYQLCANDFVWGDALKDHGIRFERPTTLSEGSEVCRFQFFKTS